MSHVGKHTLEKETNNHENRNSKKKKKKQEILDEKSLFLSSANILFTSQI